MEAAAAAVCEGAVVLDVVQLATTMRAQLEGFSEELLQRRRRPTIYRVIPSLRQGDHSAYDPQVISIGPFHHGQRGLPVMEKLKWRFLHHLLADDHDNLDRSIARVGLRVAEIRGQYSEDFEGISHEDLVKMMVLDGCFILEFMIQCFPLGESGEALADLGWDLDLLVGDLLLLENQIPFFVLETLFETTVPQSRTTLPLMELALNLITSGSVRRLPETWKPSQPQTLHLLHLFHSCYVAHRLTQENSIDCRCRQVTSYALQKTRKMVSVVVHLCLRLLAVCCVMCDRPGSSIGAESADGNSASRWVIPCATKLREAGIRFKRKETKRDGLDEFRILNVSFAEGTLEIPFLSVDDDTNSKFRNLIALEQCCPWVGDYFTSYRALMDGVVDTESDVAVIQGAGIIHHALGSGKEVATLFNSLGRGVVRSYDSHHFAQLFEDVNGYIRSDVHRWRAKLMHDYFNNPWAIISVIAAVVLLGFTIAQTFYTVYAYYRPRK